MHVITTELKKRKELNSRLYNQVVLEIKYVINKYKVGSKIMIKETDFPDEVENAYPEVFRELEPLEHTELKNKIVNYLSKISEDKIGKILNENEIRQFKENVINYNIGDFNFLINAALENEFTIKKSSPLGKKIEYVQSSGGAKYLQESVMKIYQFQNNISNNLNFYYNSLSNEENEDNSNRNKFENDTLCKTYNLDYFTIKPSRELNKVGFEGIQKFMQDLDKAKACDFDIISRIQNLLLEPKIKIKGVQKFNPGETGSYLYDYVPCLTFISENKIDAINEHLSSLDFSKQKKKEAFENFEKIQEWKNLKTSIEELKNNMDSFYINKEKLKTKICNFADFDTSSIKNCSSTSIIRSSSSCSSGGFPNLNGYDIQIYNFSKNLLNRQEFKEMFITLESLSTGIERVQKNIYSNCEDLRKLMESNEKKDGIEMDETTKILNSNLFSFKNQDIDEFKKSIEDTCCFFFQIQKLINFSFGFYNQQISKIKILEIQINKFLLKRYIEKDDFLAKYNGKGIKNNYGSSKRVEEISQKLTLLENSKPINYMDSTTNAITNLFIGDKSYK